MKGKSAQDLKEKIKSRHQAIREKFSQKHPHAQSFFQDRRIELGKIRQHSSKLLTAGTLAGALLLNSPSPSTLLASSLSEKPIKEISEIGLDSPEESRDFLVEQIKKIIPQMVCPLTPEQEKNIAFIIEKLTGIRARATLEGEHLNTCFGLIGAEQHLPRFPGDSVSLHDGFRRSGITPGRGAWGYFVQSREKLQPDDIQREKYYVAVQTLYLPDWEKRLPYLRDWYKYRKVLVLNPQTGKAVVAVVADSGPAAWTGKHFGGSPEVMYELGLHKGPRKGPVLLFFVDDAENKVPLGPIQYDKIDLSKVQMNESS